MLESYGEERQSIKNIYLCLFHGSVHSCGVAGQGAPFPALWVCHHSTVLAAQVHLAKLCSSSTWCTELRLDHLGDRDNTVPRVRRYYKVIWFVLTQTKLKRFTIRVVKFPQEF